LAIAATANVHRVPLLTYDARDFSVIEDLVDIRVRSARTPHCPNPIALNGGVAGAPQGAAIAILHSSPTRCRTKLGCAKARSPATIIPSGSIAGGMPAPISRARLRRIAARPSTWVPSRAIRQASGAKQASAASEVALAERPAERLAGQAQRRGGALGEGSLVDCGSERKLGARAHR
jgi:hypothetical protein